MTWVLARNGYNYSGIFTLMQWTLCVRNRQAFVKCLQTLSLGCHC